MRSIKKAWKRQSKLEQISRLTDWPIRLQIWNRRKRWKIDFQHRFNAFNNIWNAAKGQNPTPSGRVDDETSILYNRYVNTATIQTQIRRHQREDTLYYWNIRWLNERRSHRRLVALTNGPTVITKRLKCRMCPNTNTCRTIQTNRMSRFWKCTFQKADELHTTTK